MRARMCIDAPSDAHVQQYTAVGSDESPRGNVPPERLIPSDDEPYVNLIEEQQFYQKLCPLDRTALDVPVAARRKNYAGSRSGDRRHEARGVRARQTRARSLNRTVRSAHKCRSAAPPYIWSSVQRGVAALGLSAYGSSFASVRQIKAPLENLG